MNDQERSIINNAVGIITEVIEHSERQEIGQINVQLLVKEAERIAYQKAQQEEERKTMDFRLASKKQAADAIHLRREFEALQKAHGANYDEIIMLKTLESGLRGLVRDISEQCKAQPDSVVSTLVLEKIGKFYEGAKGEIRAALAAADAAQPVGVVVDLPSAQTFNQQLAGRMHESRQARIEAAKALSEKETAHP